MELYRRSNVFDRMLAFYASVLCSETQGRQILELVYRSIQLGGGMTLTTRMGIENWLAIERVDGKEQAIIKEIGPLLQEHIDVSAAQDWKLSTGSVHRSKYPCNYEDRK
jgi:Nucleolar pre-ribosomal-associated protein 1